MKTNSQCVSGSAIGWRHVITLLTYFGFFFVYALRVNLSVAIVAMVNHTALHEAEEATNKGVAYKTEICTRENTSTIKKDGPFVWDAVTQGNVLGSFFYGYITTQIIGGLLAQKFGAKWVFGWGTFLTIFFTMVTPYAAQGGAGYVIFVRISMGIAQGVTLPAIQQLFSNWAPPSERSKLPSFAISGCHIGTLGAFLISGYLADSNIMGGWPSVFYVLGMAGCVWLIFWTLLVSNGPEEHRFIGDAEKAYIVNSINMEGRSTKSTPFSEIPLKQILCSKPVWAAMLSHFTYNWALYVMLTGLPMYFKSVLGFDLKANGLLSSIPYLVKAIVQSFAGAIADLMRTRYKLSTTTVRKIMDCTGHLLPGVAIICVGYVGCDSAAAVALLVVSFGISGLCGAGFVVNFLDLCPQFSGFVFGISNTLATLPGIIGPNITGFLTKGEPSFESWRIVFYINGAMYFVSAIFYGIFGQGNLQNWAKQKSTPSPVLLEQKQSQG